MEEIITTNSLSHFIPSSPYYHRPLMTVASNMSSHSFHRFPLRPQPFPPFLGFAEPHSPLDLSVKNTIPITPPCTPSPPRKANRTENNNNEPSHEDKNNEIVVQKNIENEDYEMTQDLSLKVKKTKRRHDDRKDDCPSEQMEDSSLKPPKIIKHQLEGYAISDGQKTPDLKESDYPERYSPEIDIVNIDDKPKKTIQKTSSILKKNKAVRKLLFDEDKSSPVSGTIIRELADDETLVVRKGDIDPAFNVVEITEEAKATLASIENKLGSYICRLCRQLYEDAFTLAQHRCSRIVHIEYRCPECDKVFNCPANLASHRRWHKPRVPGDAKHRKLQQSTTVVHDRERVSNDATDLEVSKFPCAICGKVFRRQAYLRKHLASHSSIDGEDRDIDKITELTKSPKSSYDFDDEIKVADESFHDKFIKLQTGGQESSAFRQVQSDIKNKINQYEIGDEIRDTNFNTFWNKIPSNLGVNYFSYNDNPSDRFGQTNYYKNIQNYERSQARYVSSIASESEESQTLDITGSEDERTIADKDIPESSKTDLNMESN